MMRFKESLRTVYPRFRRLVTARARAFAFLSIHALASLSMATVVDTVETTPVFVVESETANLSVDRVDYSYKSVPVITRSFRRLEKDRGIFGAGWCSNLDLVLIGVDEASPKQIELHDCRRTRAQGTSRIFRKILNAWVEGSTASRILQMPDGKWQLTEAPHAIFRSDGKLDSFASEPKVRWQLRRATNGIIEAIDNQKDRPIKLRRNVAGDLDAILDGKGRTIAKYMTTTILQAAETGGTRESYEYDSDLNILKLMRNSIGQASQLWRFSYTTTEWVSTVNQPDGCVSRFVFDRSVVPYQAKESKSCREETLGTAKPVVAATQLKRGVASTPGARKEPGVKLAATAMLTRTGAMGVGTEKAAVTLNGEGLPILFEVLGAGNMVHRIEIEREAGSGTAVSVRTGKTVVSFTTKSKAYTDPQLELLDEYDAWMSEWGSR